MLLEYRVPEVWINDHDRSVFAFWFAVKRHPEELCRRIRAIRLTVAEWRRQREVHLAQSPDLMDLAFATFFLNRTNRSGVLRAGVIGGLAQEGRWRLSARFNKRDLIQRIESIAQETNRLRVTCLDAVQLLRQPATSASTVFLFIDPPYFRKTDRRLYCNDYSPGDHDRLSRLLRGRGVPWLLSYDNCSEIRRMYRWSASLPYDLSYTAGRKRRGSEVLLVSPKTQFPPVAHPDRLTHAEVGAMIGG